MHKVDDHPLRILSTAVTALIDVVFQIVFKDIPNPAIQFCKQLFVKQQRRNARVGRSRLKKPVCQYKWTWDTFQTEAAAKLATQQTFLDCPASSFYCSANEVFTVTRLHCPHIHCSSSPQTHSARVIVSARISVSGFEDKSGLGTPPAHNLPYQLFPSAFAKKCPNFSSAPTFNVHFIDFCH